MEDFGFLQREQGFDTTSIHAGHDPSIWPSGDIVTPVCQSVSYKQPDVGQYKAGYSYSRFGNPTRLALEKALATLSGGKHCLTFSSGMTALVTVTHILKAGDHVLLGDELYGGSPKYIIEIASKFGITSSFFDPCDLENVSKHIRPETRIIWIETPSNPLVKIVDIRGLCAAARAVREDILIAVDNTFMTSYFQQPLKLGVDICMASLTKYYNGHCDVTMGAVCFNDTALFDRVHYLQKNLGTIPSPQDCALVHRSLRTLPLRMEKHMKNSVAVAMYLEKHPKIKKVLHPVLDSHPQKQLAQAQSYGHSGMMAFYVDGTITECELFLTSLRVFTLAASLGDVGSLIAMPLKMVDLPSWVKDQDSYNHQLMRASVGLEDTQDLLNDLGQALDKAFGTNEA